MPSGLDFYTASNNISIYNTINFILVKINEQLMRNNDHRFILENIAQIIKKFALHY